MPLSPEEREIARRLRAAGKTLEEIGDRFGLTRHAVRYYVKDVPCPVDNRVKPARANAYKAIERNAKKSKVLGRGASSKRPITLPKLGGPWS